MGPHTQLTNKLRLNFKAINNLAFKSLVIDLEKSLEKPVKKSLVKSEKLNPRNVEEDNTKEDK